MSPPVDANGAAEPVVSSRGQAIVDARREEDGEWRWEEGRL